MAKIPQGAAVAIGKHPIPAGATVKPDASQRIDPLDGEAAPEESTTDALLKPASVTGAAARGLAQGTTLGFGDEAMGAIDTGVDQLHRRAQEVWLEQAPMRDAVPAVNPTSPHIAKSWTGNKGQSAGDFAKEQDRIIPEQPAEEIEQPSLRNVYRAARDRFRDDNDASKAAHPYVYGGSELVGSIAVPGGGAAKGAGLASKVYQGAKGGAKLGAVMAAGTSGADLASGDVNEAKKFVADTSTGALLGAGGGALGGVADAAASRLASRFGGAATAARAAKEAADLEEAVASATGALGQKTQDANRTLENLTNALKNENVPELLKRDIEEFLATKEGKDLAAGVAASSLSAAPRKMGELAEKKAALVAAPEEAAKKSSEYFAKNTLTNDVAPRVAHYGKPAAAAVLGGALGGPAGSAAGPVIAAAVGKPGRAAANLWRTPRFQVQLNELLATGAEGLGDLFGSASPAIAAQKTPEARMALATKTLEEDPEAAARVQKVLDARQSPAVSKTHVTLKKRFSQ